LLNFDTEYPGEGTFDRDRELALEAANEHVNGTFGTNYCDIVNVYYYKTLFGFGGVDTGIKGRRRGSEFSEH